MHSANHWGGTFEINADSTTDDDRSRNMDLDRGAVPRHELDETQQSWLLDPQDHRTKKKKYVDLGCIVCSKKVFKWTVWSIIGAILIIALPIIIVKTLPKHKEKPAPPDEYTMALHKALMFFNAQKSGKLPKNNGVPWRGDSGLHDGSDLPDVKGGLVGGYYDAGDNIKFHFPMSFALTMLSWTVIEYPHKYQAIGEYNHVRELIKWGTDYLLLTFNSSSDTINYIYSQVGRALNGTNIPDDHYCWQKPEDMDYPRPVERTDSGPELAGEMAAALASASIVFRDEPKYSQKLVKGAATLYKFARDRGKRSRYSEGKLYIQMYYNSSGYYDEYMWSAAWLYYATGNTSYLSLATNPGIPKHSYAFSGSHDLHVLSWDNKLPAAQLLLTRLRIFLNPGYPYEDMLKAYHNNTGNIMCSYLQQFKVFNYTRGGLIQLNHGRPQMLQYAANSAFLASLYADYMSASGIPGWHCGPYYFSTDVLKQFAKLQIDYILGKNPKKMSYVVGYGTKYPKQLHHRGASIPRNVRSSCTGGWKYRDSKNPNPNLIVGAMAAGPDKFDGFLDVRNNYSYTEPTLAANAGLVSALISLTGSGNGGIDKNTIFSSVPPLYPTAPPPPQPWRP